MRLHPTRLPALPLLLAFALAGPASGATYLYSGTDAGVIATVSILADSNGDDVYETLYNPFQPFGPYKGGVRVATGDFDGDGNDEIVLATGKKGGGRVDVYDLQPDGTIGIRLDSFFAFAPAPFAAGVNVAAGDIDDDGRDELVVAGDVKSEGLVRIYSDLDADGQLSDDVVVDELVPFGPSFKGGVAVALGDVTNNGGEELIVGQASAGRHVRVYSDADLDGVVSEETVVDEFDAFGPGYKSGVTLAAGPFENVGTGGAEVVVGAAKKLGEVEIWSDVDADGVVAGDGAFQTLAAYEQSKGGVRVAAGDTDGSGVFVELLTGPGKGPEARLQIFDDTADSGFALDAVPFDEALPFGEHKKGIFVAIGRVRDATYYADYDVVPVGIPDAATVVTPIFVPPGAGVVRSVEVFLAIQHTFNGDLDATLTHVPSGTSVALFTDVGGTDEGMIIRLDDDAVTDIGTADNPTDGTLFGSFNPEGMAALAAFDDLDASGEWRLTITDDSASDTGVLHAFQLHFEF
jgi:subtilisin-like proprotein convertase family protein